jgi:arylsulfatase
MPPRKCLLFSLPLVFAMVLGQFWMLFVYHGGNAAEGARDDDYSVQRQPQQGQDEEENNEMTAPPLNILLLYADDWRYDTLGIAGNPIVKTPVLDQLASEGIHFTENCVTTSICWVSRATLFTGQYMARHGTKKRSEFFANPNETIFALLQNQGYYNGHVGKLGTGKSHFQKPYIPGNMGVYGGWHVNKQGLHITDKNTMDALKFLDKRPRSRPFFLHLGFYATHAVDGDPRQYIPQNGSMSMYVNDTVPFPITGREKSWKKMPSFFTDSNEGRYRFKLRYDTVRKHQSMMKNYYRMASEVDTACGKVLKKLEEQGELNNTLIIFTTDNGNFHAEHGLADKWYPHQESIRVPLIIKDPRMPKHKAGTVNDEFTLNIDLAPTILAAAGVEALPSMMGRDMSVLYRSEVSLVKDSRLLLSKDFTNGSNRANWPLNQLAWRREFFYEHPVISNARRIPSSEALVRKDYKYLFWPDFQTEQLFHLTTDPIEDNDLISKFNSTKKEHVKKLHEMRKRFKLLKEIVHSSDVVTL